MDSDNTRQEAIERAAEMRRVAEVTDDGDLLDVLDDYSRLIDQLTEAIAQRDEPLERTKLLDNALERWGGDAAVSWHADTQQWAAHHRMYHQDVRVEALERQLTEAIAQRDLAREETTTVDRAYREQGGQLAAERALSDRLAVMLRAANILLDEHGILDDCITIEDALAHYDAHRAQ